MPLAVGALGQGIPPDLLAGIVPVREDGGHVEPVAQEGVEAQASEGVVAHDDGLGAHGWRSVPSRITCRITKRGRRRTSM